MSAAQEEINWLKSEIADVKALLENVRAEALADDGIIDAGEAAEISAIEGELEFLKGELASLEAEVAEEEDGGGFFSDLVDGVTDAIETAASAITGAGDNERTQSVSSETEPASAIGRSITGSVGKGGQNAKPDVSVVQNLLNKAGSKLKVDGLTGPKTNGAISDFQSSNACPVSSLITPNDETWNVLLAGGRMGQAATQVVEAAESAGDWLSDAASAVVETVQDIGDAVFGEDDPDEELQRIYDELVELEHDAEAL